MSHFAIKSEYIKIITLFHCSQIKKAIFLKISCHDFVFKDIYKIINTFKFECNHKKASLMNWFRF
jgi:hypothetical protein